MEDLSAMLQAVLNDPDTMQKLRGTLDALTGTETQPSPVPPDEQTPDLSGLLQLMPLLQNASAETDDIRLLHALRPYLHGERAKRLEQAGRMLRLRGMLPLLQQSGLLSGLLGGDG